LAQLARNLFYERPVLYGSLSKLFDELLSEYDEHDAIPTDRADRIKQHLTPAVLDAVNAEFDPPANLLNALNELYRAQHSL